MQQKLVAPANGDLRSSATSSRPFTPSNHRPSASPHYTNVSDFFPLYPSVFSHDSAVSFDEAKCRSSNNDRFQPARLALQYQEIADRYDLCLAHLHDAALEAEALRCENAQLQIANGELSRRLGLDPSCAIPPQISIADEFRRLRFVDPPASPTSVLGPLENKFGSGVQQKITLPKSISVRSSGYVKSNDGPPPLNRTGQHRVSTPVMVESQRVYVESNKSKEADDPLEFEVFNQGMFKTELCNKWEETGHCPYGPQCQFAHGIPELRPVIRHPRYKTEFCRMILAGDRCPYGHRCHFRHTISQP